MSDNSNLPIPAPAGTNANGDPYWIIKGQQITWAQMQQLIWQQMQKQQAAMSAGKGPEQIPNIPRIDELLDAVTKPDMAVESNLERGPVLRIEKSDSNIEKGNTQNQQTTAAIKKEEPKPVKQKGASVVGDTHKGAANIFSDVSDMFNFYRRNQAKAKQPNPKNADDYLVVLVERLLRMMATSSK